MGLSLAAAAIIASAASAGVGAYSAHQSGKAADLDSKNQQTIANANAAKDEMKAAEELELSSYEARQHRKDAQKFQATQRASLLANGATLESGSPLLILQESAEIAQRDNASILRDGYVRSNDYQHSSYMNRWSGDAARSRGKAAKSVSNWQAGSALIGGAVSTAGMAYEFNK